MADDNRVFDRTSLSLAAAGYDVHLIARAPGDRPYEEGGVTIHPLPNPGSRRSRLARRSMVADIAAGLSPDLYHVHEPELLGPVLARAGSRPVIWDAHESYLDVIRERDWIPAPVRPFVAWAWDRVERRHLRRCAAVITVTEPIAQRYRRLHKRVTVLKNFPRIDDLPPPPSKPRDGRTCVFAGTILPNRNVEGMIRALGILRSRGLDVKLTLAGRCSDDYKAALLAEVNRLGVADLVTFLGPMPRHEALRLQNESSICPVPLLPRQSMLNSIPVKMVECMALGLPQVYSNFPGFEEIAGAAGAGIAVDPTRPDSIADAIEVLVRNPEQARRMGDAGRRAVADRFNWEVEQEKLFELYDELIGVSAQPAELSVR